MGFTPPTVAQFQAQFSRDFPYGSGLDSVTSQDIQNAYNEAFGLFKPALFDTTLTLQNPSIFGNIIQGSNLITSLSTIAGIAPGQTVIGPGIPANTTVTFVGATSVTLSANATLTLGGAPFTFALVIAGNTIQNTNTILGLASTIGLAPGQTIAGTGIPAGTTIIGVGINSITISANATATNNGVSLSISQTTGFTVNEQTIAYLYLSAHLLVLSLQASGGLGAPGSKQGAASSGGGIVNAKTVGSVSLNYEMPDFVRTSPTLSQYMRTGYGQKYLQMVAPKLPGRGVMVVQGEPTIGNARINNATAFIPTSVL